MIEPAKYYMWVTSVDHEEGVLWAEGYKEDENGEIDSNGLRHEMEIELEYLKEELSEEDYNDMIGGGSTSGFFLGQIFDYEESEDGSNKITLLRDERTEEEKKGDMEAAKWRAAEWMKFLKPE